MEPAAVVLTHLLDRAPTLGRGRLLCIDGPAGSGKTTLAAAVVERSPEARVVHMDDLYDGWSGLPRVAGRVAGLLEPLAWGEAGSYRRYDWYAGRYAETVIVEPSSVLVLEGVGSGMSEFAHLITLLVWVGAPADLRLRRGVERDGEGLRDRLLRWQVDEAEHFARERTEARADLHVDGAGRWSPQVRRDDQHLG